MLNRHIFAEEITDLAVTCKAPMAIGLYGTLGSGKTTFMRQMNKMIASQYKDIQTFWFNPWQYQFVQNPAVALLQVVVNELEPKIKRESKKLLSVIAAALSGKISKITTGLKITEVLEIGKIYEGEHFQLKDEHVRLHEYFTQIIEKAKGKNRRIIFFIDDLDRCNPEIAISMLESLKLYLNINECIYFLGMDREVITRTVKQKYKELYKSEDILFVDYLDKIIQLPFNIPPIEPEQMNSFINEFLPKDLCECRKILVEGLGRNPRQVKRFINFLKLNFSLAKKQKQRDIKPQPLTLLLLFQLMVPELYKEILNTPGIFLSLKKESKDVRDLIDKYLVPKSGLLNAINIAKIDEDIDLTRYLYLTKTIRVSDITKEDVLEKGKPDLLEQHNKWYVSL